MTAVGLQFGVYEKAAAVDGDVSGPGIGMIQVGLGGRGMEMTVVTIFLLGLDMNGAASFRGSDVLDGIAYRGCRNAIEPNLPEPPFVVPGPVVEIPPNRTVAAHKNTMVGVMSFYGEVPPEKSGKTSVKDAANRQGPKRLAGYVAARMPEDKFPTFREKLETEIRSPLKRLPPDVVKILLNDGGTNLWTHADAEPLYDGFGKIVAEIPIRHHVLDHVTSGAEGIFGKGTADGKVWYRKMEGTLLSYEDGAERVIRSKFHWTTHAGIIRDTT